MGDRGSTSPELLRERSSASSGSSFKDSRVQGRNCGNVGRKRRGGVGDVGRGKVREKGWKEG